MKKGGLASGHNRKKWWFSPMDIQSVNDRATDLVTYKIMAMQVILVNFSKQANTNQ